MSDPQHDRLRNMANWRGRRRAANHDAAHGDDAHAPPPADLPLVCAAPPVLIESDAELASLLGRLRAAGRFAFDSEFIGEASYHARLCLVQIATADEIALIDPLAGVDLRPLWDLLCDPAVEKIAHAADQDVEPPLLATGRPVARLFDTQIAAGFVAMAYPVALNKLIHQVLGIRIAKGLTFTQWDQRPLSRQQLRYAADDVRYLPAVHERLTAMLRAGRTEGFAAAEMQARCDPARFAFDAAAVAARMRGAGSLEPREALILRELAAWRDAAARQADLPPRVLLRDELLIDLARRSRQTIESLRQMRGMPAPIVDVHGRGLLDALQRGRDAPRPSGDPRPPEPTPAERFRADALAALVESLAAARGIDPALLASKSDLIEVDRALAGGGDLQALPLMTGWRRDAVGRDALAVLRGEARISLGWRDGRLDAEYNPR